MPLLVPRSRPPLRRTRIPSLYWLAPRVDPLLVTSRSRIRAGEVQSARRQSRKLRVVERDS